MVRLSQEVIEQAFQSTNAIKDRQLDLRDYKIPAIENLGATLDQFDTIDFTDNEIKKLENFPLLKRLKTLLLSNNQIHRIGENLEANLPNLKSLVLINNRIQELGDIDSLATIGTLESLSLLTNPVAKKQHYRHYVAHKLPQLKRLDFQKIKDSERQAAAKFFSGKTGEDLLNELSKKSKANPSVFNGPASHANKQPTASTKEMELLKKAVAKASTLEEVERLNNLIQTGQSLAGSATTEEMDVDE